MKPKHPEHWSHDEAMDARIREQEDQELFQLKLGAATIIIPDRSPIVPVGRTHLRIRGWRIVREQLFFDLLQREYLRIRIPLFSRQKFTVIFPVADLNSGKICNLIMEGF